MNADAKKTVLRMIPYGIYVLTADDGKGNIAAATVNWVTQSAFAPPLVVVGINLHAALDRDNPGDLRRIGQAQRFAHLFDQRLEIDRPAHRRRLLHAAVR